MTRCLLSGVACSFLVLSGAVNSSEPLRSGPQVGESNNRRPFGPKWLSGPWAGKGICPVASTYDLIALVFVRATSDSLTGLVKKTDRRLQGVVHKTPSRLGAFVMFMNDAPGLAQDALRKGEFVDAKADKIVGAIAAVLPPEVVAVVPTSRDKEQNWRYTFTRPAAHWFKPDFNDLSWKTGPGGFGNKGTPNSVDRTPWHTREIWLRREILLPDGPFTHLQFQVHADDYADIYLNGVLAARVTKCTPGYVEIPISEAARKTLRPGSNVLAATCRDTGGGRYLDVGLVVPVIIAAAKKKPEDRVVVCEDELVNADLKDTVLPESFRKTYTIKLEKHQLYQVILTTQAFAPHLRLETAAREQIKSAASEKPGSVHFFHRPVKTEELVIIATSQKGGAMGKFTLLIKEIAGGNGEPMK
jgi:hypothetical protein